MLTAPEQGQFYVIIFLLVFSKPSITCFNRTSLWVAFLSKYIFQWIVLKIIKKKKTTQTQPKKQTNPPKPTHTHPHPPAVQLGCVAYPPIKKRLLCLPENSPSLQGDYWLLGRSPWGNERRRTKSVSVRMWVYALAHTRVRETKK